MRPVTASRLLRQGELERSGKPSLGEWRAADSAGSE